MYPTEDVIYLKYAFLIMHDILFIGSNNWLSDPIIDT